MIAANSTLQWSEEEPPVAVSTCHELDEALHRVAARCTPKHPILIALYVHGYEVGIGLGLPESFVNIKNWERGTPVCCLITVGDGRAQRGTVFFYLNTHPIEIRQRNLIPTTRARQVVREFFETGRRSTSVEWEEL
jgi:Immunity protein Imm1